jgi:sugar phosphate permease
LSSQSLYLALLEGLYRAGFYSVWEASAVSRDGIWLFLIEGFLPVLMGLCAFFLLNDRPRDASWLSEGQKQVLISNLPSTTDRHQHSPVRAFLTALKNPKLWVSTFGYF